MFALRVVSALTETMPQLTKVLLQTSPRHFWILMKLLKYVIHVFVLAYIILACSAEVEGIPFNFYLKGSPEHAEAGWV